MRHFICLRTGRSPTWVLFQYFYIVTASSRYRTVALLIQYCFHVIDTKEYTDTGGRPNTPKQNNATRTIYDSFLDRMQTDGSNGWKMAPEDPNNARSRQGSSNAFLAPRHSRASVTRTIARQKKNSSYNDSSMLEKTFVVSLVIDILF